MPRIKGAKNKSKIKVEVKTKITKKGRDKEVELEKKTEIPVEVPKPEVKVPEIVYVQEIVIKRDKIVRLNDERDTQTQFHCSVNGGEYTAHFDKILFIEQKVGQL